METEKTTKGRQKFYRVSAIIKVEGFNNTSVTGTYFPTGKTASTKKIRQQCIDQLKEHLRHNDALVSLPVTIDVRIREIDNDFIFSEGDMDLKTN